MYKCFILNADNGFLIKRGLGAYRIASFLRENNWDAEVIEFAIHWTFDQLKEMARSRIDSNFKFIGISTLFLNEKVPVLEFFLDWVKKEYPHIKIILGGPERYRYNNPNIDYNINGYGEKSLLVLLEYLFSNGSTPKFSMHLNSGKNIAANEHYPAYPMKSLMVKYEDRDFINKDEWLGTEFARGCVFSCAFCNFPVLGVKGDYSRDADDFERQVKDAYDRFGITNYYCTDETFNDRTEKITKFADVVEKLNFTPYFTGFIRADLLVSRPMDREELLRMNFLGHFYGVETFYHQSGKVIGKGMNPDKLKQGLIDIKNFFERHVNNKFRATISLIAGLPHEPKESLYETKEWLKENWQGHAFSMYPLEIPNSEFYNSSKISADWQKYGYRDISKSTENNLQGSAMDYKDILIWANEFMTIYDAEKISKDVESLKDDYPYMYGNFALIRSGLGSLNERLNLLDRRISLREVHKPFVNDYINKKLSL